MDTTELQTPKRKELSAFASFEIAMSVIAFISLLLPLATADFLGTETSYNYFQMNKTFMVWIAYALPIVHILVKLHVRNSWLPLLTSFLTVFFLLGIIIEIGEGSGSSSMGYGMSMSFEPAIGYYMAWIAFVGLVISLLVSWTLFLGNKIVNYKRWIIISIALIGLSILGFTIGYITNSLASALLLTEISPIGLIILPGAICSYFIHRKEKGEEDNSKHTTSNALSKIPSNIAKAFQKLPHKKEIAIGALALIAIVAGVSMCGGNDSETSDENKLQTWDKFVKITADDVNLRKEPDTNSARLMISAGEMDDYYSIVWSDKTNDDSQPYYIRKNYVCPVVDETGEWFKIHIKDNVNGNYHAYIMKKFCEEVTPEPIKDKEYQYYNIRKIEGEVLNGCYVMSCTEFEPGNSKVLLKLGYAKDNAYIFYKSIIVEDSRVVNKKPYELYIHPQNGENILALPQSCFDSDGVKLDKFTDKHFIEWLVFGMGTYTEKEEVYYCFEGAIYNY